MGIFRLIQHENASTLAPLCCCRPLAQMELCGTTFGNLLEQRWQRVLSAFPGDGSVLSVASDFWPSDLLLEKLSALGKPFSATFSGEEVCRISSPGCADASALCLEADSGCVFIRYPWDLLAIHEKLLSGITESRVAGTVRAGATIDGILILGEGSVILPGVYIEGVAVIGKNCKIGPNAYLRGNCSVGDNCHIGQAVEIKNSILMTHVAAGHLSYIGDSIVCRNVNFGAGTITSNFRHDGKNHRSMVNGVLLDTGRRKFGSIIGENVHTGIHTSVYPGRKIWAGVSIRPGTVVQRDLAE